MVEDKKAGEQAPASSEVSSGHEGVQQPAKAEAEPDDASAPSSADEEAAQATEASAPNPQPQQALVPAAARESAAQSPELKAAAPVSPSKPVGTTGGRRVYQAGGVRKTLLSFAFLLLLPFFASLPAMIYQRLTHQLWVDTLGFAIFAAAFAAVMLLVTFELIHSIRSRVEIGESAVRLTLPAARGIAMPKFFYRKHEVPYSEIEVVETRREVYGGTVAPVMLRGARIVTKTGDKIPLGYVSEANVDPMLPVPEIASEIARRAGLEVVDRGTVRRQVHKKLRGIKADDATAKPITDADIAALNSRHNTVMLALCSLMFLLVAGGLMLDISKSNLDLGERAHQLVQQLSKPSPQAQARTQ